MAEQRERGLKKLSDGRWRWSYTDPAGKYHRNVARTKGEARAFLEKARTEIREGRWLDRKKTHQTGIEEACKRFLEWGKENLSKSTQQHDELFAGRWKASPHLKGRLLTQISPVQVEAYKVEEKAAHGVHQADYSVRRLRRMFNLCLVWNLCEENPASGGKVKLHTPKVRRDRILSPEEEAIVLEAACGRLRAAIVFSLHTGLRQGELVALKWSDFNSKVGRYGEVKVRGDHAKDREDRHIPLTATARAALDALPRNLDGEARIWAHLGSSRENINTLWYQALRGSKVNQGVPKAQRITWHTLRHTYASRLVMAGVDLATVQRLLGHSSITTTMRYAHLARPHIEEAVLALDSNLHFTCNSLEHVPGTPMLQEQEARAQQVDN